MVMCSKYLNFRGIYSVAVYNIKTDFHIAINHNKTSLFLSISATYFSHTDHPQAFKHIKGGRSSVKHNNGKIKHIML